MAYIALEIEQGKWDNMTKNPGMKSSPSNLGW